jgi:2-polyprenyl-6-methoxyphenol hydroxylase-like FAD-dependent oxidoreductase
MAAAGPKQNVDPVVIVGMGPGGLAAALVAAKKGLPVVIIENRDHFSRVQRLHADRKTMQFLQSFYDPNNALDKEFFEKKCFAHKNPDGTFGDAVVQIKDIQKFLTRKLEAYQNVDIRRGKGHEITALDPDQQTVSLKKPDGSNSTVKFSNVVAADGARRGVTSFLNASKNQAYHVEHTPMALQPRQAQAGTVALQVKAGQILPDTPSGASGSNFTIQHMAKLNELGWDQQYFPKIRVFRNEENTKFFFSGEIPKTIQNIQDKNAQKQALEEWGKFIVSVEMGVDPTQLEIPIKAGINSTDATKAAKTKESQAMRTTAFELSLASADKSAVELGQQGAFALVGDAYKNANFFYGHGLNDAIQDGIKAAECIGPKGKFNFNDYETHQQNQLNSLNKNMGMEASLPVRDLPQVFSKMNDDVEKLMSIAKKMNDPAVIEVRKGIQTMAQPGEKGFDGRLYAMELDRLVSKMNNFLNAKMIAPQNRGVIHMTGDKNKFTTMSNEVSTLNKEISKDMTKFFKTNNENRISLAQQLSEQVQEKPKTPPRAR